MDSVASTEAGTKQSFQQKIQQAHFCLYLAHTKHLYSHYKDKLLVSNRRVRQLSEIDCLGCC